MARQGRVVVVGSSNIDMVVRSDRLPLAGETVLGGDLMMVGGGKGANQAVAAAKLGAVSTFVGRLGTDIFGERASAILNSSGVDTTYVTRDPETHSGVALISVAKSGENSIVVAPGANGKLCPKDVDAARPALEQAHVIMVQFEIPLETIAHTIRLAKELDKIMIVNPAPYQNLPAGFLNGVDVLTPNRIESAHLLDQPPTADPDGKAMAKALLDLGVGTIIVTLGKRGTVVATKDRVSEIPGKRVTSVDATAAGDAFNGALAVALAEGLDVFTAAHFANAAGALAVTKVGAQTSMPTRAELDELIQKR
jgi:ribokinase